MASRLLLLGSLMLCVCTRAFASPLLFSAIPHQDSRNETALYSILASRLAEELDVEVAFVASTDYGHTVELFSRHEISFAWFGGLTGLLARRADPGAQVIARGFEDQFFKSLLIANRSTGLRPERELPAGIRGRSLALGSELSTSGRLFPEYFMQNHFGKPISQVFPKVAFSGGHEKTVRLVEQGLYEVGFVNYRIWYDLLQRGRVNTEQVHVIWETPLYPDYHFLVRSDIEKRFGAGFRSRLQDALLRLSADGRITRVFRRSHFVKASNEDLAGVEDAARALGLVD